uniref:NADH-ubiquinone oxidoreductase chain 2 n=1 Tax=Isodiametra pulchra TaxID=504439 RepID=A0A1X9WD94_ISOPU|nr:NADH dehydrogenase subunit 2 [Isodiametra pulchra]ARS00903.1 NADH dehydrogenase subunit 2 [Isodiametra pulchra]
MIFSTSSCVAGVLMYSGISIFFFFHGNALLTWMCLEIVSWALLPILLQKKSLTTKEGMMKYFMIQSLASLLFLGSLLLWEESFMGTGMSGSLKWSWGCSFSLLLKMGFFPFHGWVMELLSASDFIIALILLGLQKILPLVLFLKLSLWQEWPIFLSYTILMLTCIFLLWGLPQVKSFILLFFFSGIYHLSVLFFMMMNEIPSLYLVVYFGFYLFFLFVIFFVLQSCKIFLQQDLLLKTGQHFLFIGLAVSGLPPFAMFFMKSFFLYHVSFAMTDLSIFFLITLIVIYMFSFLSFFFESGSNQLSFSLMNSEGPSRFYSSQGWINNEEKLKVIFSVFVLHFILSGSVFLFF